MSLAHLHTPRMSDTKPYFSERLTAEEEKQMAREIRKAEQEAREAVAGIDEADSILMRRPDRAERTRAGAVDRLEEAVKADSQLGEDEASTYSGTRDRRSSDGRAQAVLRVKNRRRET